MSILDVHAICTKQVSASDLMRAVTSVLTLCAPVLRAKRLPQENTYDDGALVSDRDFFIGSINAHHEHSISTAGTRCSYQSWHGMYSKLPILTTFLLVAIAH